MESGVVYVKAVKGASVSTDSEKQWRNFEKKINKIKKMKERSEWKNQERVRSLEITRDI